MSGFRRRRVLSVGLLSLVSGCSQFGESTPEKRLFRKFRVWNRDDTSHRVDIRVERDDTEIVDETVALSEGEFTEDSTASFDEAVRKEPGEFVVAFRFADAERWTTYPVTESTEARCYGCEIRITDDGEFSVWDAQLGADDCPLAGSTVW
jgi:hypothetical protein